MLASPAPALIVTEIKYRLLGFFLYPASLPDVHFLSSPDADNTLSRWDRPEIGNLGNIGPAQSPARMVFRIQARKNILEDGSIFDKKNNLQSFYERFIRDISAAG